MLQVLILIGLVLLLAQQYFGWRAQPRTSTTADNAGPMPVPGSPAAPDSAPRQKVMPPRNMAPAAQSGLFRREETLNLTPSAAHAVEAGNVPERVIPVPVARPVAVTTPVTGVGDHRAESAEVMGHVWISGTLPDEQPITMDATCGRLQPRPITTRHYVVTPEGALANVFVYIKEGLSGGVFAPSTNAAVLDNVGCLFEPYVFGLQTGQPLRIRNSDPILHNVHAAPRVNRGFNLGLPRQGQEVEKRFTHAEVFVRLKCDVHPWMFAYVGVVAHPFFAVTDTNGSFRLPPFLPPGSYTLAAHHPKAGEITQHIRVNAGESKRVDLNFQVPALPLSAVSPR